MNNKYKRVIVKNQTFQAILDWCHGWKTEWFQEFGVEDPNPPQDMGFYHIYIITP
jgi:hypothetical protein